MKLIDRQIKGIQQVIAKVEKEYAANKVYYKWESKTCPLCKMFDGALECADTLKCPIMCVDSEGCANLTTHLQYDYMKVRLEEIAGFLQSLLITLELMKEGK